MRLMPLFCTIVAGLLAGLPVTAQSPFSPQVIVNDRVITGYELEQRALLLELLNTPGDLVTEARQALIEDRIRLQVAETREIEVTAEQITTGMTEFAQRGQLTLDQFLAALAERGVAQETFRDFVTAGLAWREVVRARYAGQISVSEAEVDRALSLAAQRGAVRLLLSELILPATPDVIAQTRPLADELSRTLSGEAAFAAAAAQYSIAASRDQGGRIDWIPVANLPPAIGALLTRLRPGQISPPVAVPGAIALFLLRGIDEAAPPGPAATQVEYAQLRLAGGRSAATLAEAGRIRETADDCDDLYTIAKALPPDRLTRDTLPLSQVPQDVALELAKLDANEMSAGLVRGDTLVLVMLCAREPLRDEPPSRNAIRDQLVNARAVALSEVYLAELIANADIRTP